MVELLVVIGIIAILAALLIPVLAAARLRSQQSQCLNNERQMALVSFMYAGDSGRPILFGNPRYPGDIWMGSVVDLIKNRKTFLCPAAPPRNPPPESGNRLGAADAAWVRWTANGREMFEGSYGYNAWLCPDLSKYYPKPDGLVYTAAESIENTAQTPVIVDSNWEGLSPMESDPPWPNLYTGIPLGIDATMGRATIARHGGVKPSLAPRNFPAGEKLPGAINMVFADGHAQLVPLEDLWHYNWHHNWAAPATHPP